STPAFDDCGLQPEYGDCLIRGAGSKCGRESATASSAVRFHGPVAQAEETWLREQVRAALLRGTRSLILVSLHCRSRSPLRVPDALRDGILPASFPFASQFLKHLFRRNTSDRARFHLCIATYSLLRPRFCHVRIHRRSIRKTAHKPTKQFRPGLLWQLQN